MIDSKSLRLGNIIQYKGDLITITAIYSEGIESEEEEVYAIENVEAVALTKEWMIKFGYTENSDDCTYSTWTHEIEDAWIIEENGVFESYYNSVDFKITSVHQLQNYVMAHTGKELNLIL